MCKTNFMKVSHMLIDLHEDGKVARVESVVDGLTTS